MDDDPLTIRLGDLDDHHTLAVRCSRCAEVASFPHGHLQRKHKVRSDTLIYDLQFRLRCKRCRAKGPFRISIVDDRAPDNAIPREVKVIVGSGAPKLRLVKSETT